MSQINFFAISGLDERTRHCYVLEIQHDIYVINAGVENPITESLGISKIIPDFTYLIENRQRIKAIIIGTPNMANIGSLDYLIQKIGMNIPIITNEVAKTIIETYLNSKYWQNNNRPNLQYIIANPMRDLVLDNQQVITAFRIANSLPGSIGFVFKTNDGCIIYMDNYIIASDKTKAFYSQLANIRDIIKGLPVLLLITQTGIVDKSIGFTAPHHNGRDFYENIASNTNHRIIVAIHEHDAFGIFTLAQVAKKYQKQFMIYSRSFINTFQAVIKAGLFNPKGLISIPLSEIDKTENAIIVIADEPEKLFDRMYKIIDDEDDIVHFKQTDTFVLGTKMIPGYEGHASKLLDRISQIDLKTIVMPKTILPLEPSNEDHKFTVSLIQPKYIIPVGGLFKTFIQYQNVVNQTWLKKEQVVILSNGEIAQFNNGEYTPTKKWMPAAYVQMSAYGSTDISESVLYERNQMLESGAVCISFILNDKSLPISDIEIFDYGILSHKDPLTIKIYEDIKKEIKTNIISYFVYRNDRSIDFRETKNSIKKAVAKLFDKNLNKRPIVLATIFDLRERREYNNNG